MEPVTYSASVTASTTPVGLPTVGFDIFSIIAASFGDSEAVAGFFTGGGFWGFLGSVWGTFSIFAYIVSIILLVLYVFASIRRNLYNDLVTQNLRDAEELFAQQYQTSANTNSKRLNDVVENAGSDNPNDWKLAIIEADIILDETLKQKGYIGTSLGERLRSVSASQLNTVNDAWEAHKIRNRIAHDGADFVLTKRLADETIGRYLRVFSELEVG